MPTTETKVSTKRNKSENYDDFTNYMRLIKNHHHDKYQEKSDGRYAVHCSKPGELGPDGDPGGDHDGDGDGDGDHMVIVVVMGILLMILVAMMMVSLMY